MRQRGEPTPRGLACEMGILSCRKDLVAWAAAVARPSLSCGANKGNSSSDHINTHIHRRNRGEESTCCGCQSNHARHPSLPLWGRGTHRCLMTARDNGDRGALSPPHPSLPLSCCLLCSRVRLRFRRNTDRQQPHEREENKPRWRYRRQGVQRREGEFGKIDS